VTLDVDSMTGRNDEAPGRPAEDPLFLARVKVGLGVVLVAIMAFLLADEGLPPDALHATMRVRIAQFVLIGVAGLALRMRMRRAGRVASVVAFVSGLYVTSAIAGSLRGNVATQPITDLTIAFATATTLQWGPWPQLASVVVAMLAIALDYRLVYGSFADVSPHMAAGIGVAFLVTVFIARQLDGYRRARDAAEAALRRNEERFRALIERGRDVITIVGADGLIRYDSPSIERLSGHGPEERLGRDAAAFVHPDDLELVRDAVGRARGGHAPMVEVRVPRRDGTWCEVEAVITNLLDDPAVGGIVVNWRDIGERKRADEERARYVEALALARDEALESTRAKSMFLANMSHEIRTPMNVVIGMAEMVLDSELTPEQARDLRRVHEAATGLLSIINDILDASKIEAGKMTIEAVDMDLRETLEESVRLLAPAAEAKRLRIGWHASPDLPARLRGDPARLRQAIVNLVANAVKFTEVGTVDVEAVVVRPTTSGALVRVAVTDTGIGVPLHRQAAIFESFSQADESTNRLYGGTGLGLSICTQLVTLMGGRMGIESAPGRGSRFWFEVELARATSVSGAAAA
jgi:two-component system, sensor histidine kinase and response regulator